MILQTRAVSGNFCLAALSSLLMAASHSGARPPPELLAPLGFIYTGSEGGQHVGKGSEKGGIEF